VILTLSDLRAFGAAPATGLASSPILYESDLSTRGAAPSSGVGPIFNLPDLSARGASNVDPTVVLDVDLSTMPLGPVSLPSSVVSQALVAGQIAWELILTPKPTSMITQQQTAPVMCLCEAATSAGPLTLQYEVGRWFFRLNGVAILEVLDPEDVAMGTFRNNLSQTALAGDFFRVLWGYSPATNLLYLAIVNNACASFPASNVNGPTGAIPIAIATLTAISSISAITVGSRINGTLPIGAQWLRFRVHTAVALNVTPQPRILVIGDSIMSALSSVLDPAAAAGTPSHVYSPSEAQSMLGPRILNNASGGSTIALQQAAYLASFANGLQSIVAVILLSGINDANAGESSAFIVASYKSPVNSLRATLRSGVKVLALILTPALGFLGATKWAQVVAFNAALEAGAVTGIDLVITQHFAPLSDALGNLLRKYNAPATDGVHPNDDGRIIIGQAVRVGVTAQNVL